MRVSLEISLYPLDEKYITVIEDFINKVKQDKQLKVEVNVMSTQIFGELSIILDLLKKELPVVWEKYPAVFVMKWVGRDLTA
ncbi:MAG: hypothetical protein EA412_11610 [Chitinophagaceae bacterium]|nr:MAG: hypothetical protein EA412_11610 [Chitinophagaceae bacterium]